MDIAINNTLIADFDSLSFKKLNIGIKDGIIEEISQTPIKAKKVIDASGFYLSPGFIDCHCHIESTHLMPSQFAKAVKKHGTLHVVADDHEIANVFGRKGLELFINDAKNSQINIRFAVPSCVPATEFATSGGKLDLEDIKYFLNFDEVVSLGELMNVPAVVNRDEKFMKMIETAKAKGKRINGHAPHLNHETLKAYKDVGVEDDHESYDYDELKEKIELGFFVFLREGSTEHSTDKAYKIIEEYPDKVAFCTDDKSINDILSKGHIDYNLRKAIKNGIDPILALKTASFNGLKYYGLDEFSSIEVGKKAFLILLNQEFEVVNTFTPNIKEAAKKEENEKFKKSIIVDMPVILPEIENKKIAIGIKDGSLITEKINIENVKGEFDLKNDLLKLVVIERYGHNNKAACFVKGFNIKNGALATSLAHDCHNIVAVGSSNENIKKAVETIIQMQGGQVVIKDGKLEAKMNLPVGGIVSDKEPEEIAKDVDNLREKAKSIGCSLTDPFGMLSFMALEVIPHIKLTDKGLFDVDRFEYIR